MAVLVESYQIEDYVADESFDSSEELNALHAELELEGQKSIVVKDKIVPFNEMTKEEHFVFTTLCPVSCELGKYSASPIPLRVLQLAKLAKKTEYFTELVVWDRESSMIVDPVLVGIHKEGYNPKFYLIARWGKELDTYSTLLTKALELAKNAAISRLQDIQQTVTNRLSRLRNNTALTLNDVKLATFYN